MYLPISITSLVLVIVATCFRTLEVGYSIDRQIDTLIVPVPQKEVRAEGFEPLAGKSYKKTHRSFKDQKKYQISRL